jgi:hypothetical protein
LTDRKKENFAPEASPKPDASPVGRLRDSRETASNVQRAMGSAAESVAAALASVRQTCPDHVNDRTDRIAARLTDIAQRHRAASSGSSEGLVPGAWAGGSPAPRDLAGAVTLDPVQEFES